MRAAQPIADSSRAELTFKRTDLLVFRQEVFDSFMCRKLLVIRGMIEANGFEPPSSWFRTSLTKSLSLLPGATYGS